MTGTVCHGDRGFDHGGRLRALAAKGAASAWDPESAIDWSAAVAPPWWMPRRTFVSLVSQLHHGETATLDLCRRLHEAVPDADARAFLGTQIADEARHVSVYKAYLDRLGDVAPAHEALRIAHAAGRSWQGSWPRLVVAFHVVLEGEALRLQQEFIRAFGCPLLRQITLRTSRDEARHVAFGRLYLRQALAELPFAERVDIYRWTRRLWQDCAEALRTGYGGLGTAVLRWHQIDLDARWRAQVETLRDIGLIRPGEEMPR